MISTCTYPKHTQVHSWIEGHRDVSEFPVGFDDWKFGGVTVGIRGLGSSLG